MPKGVILTRMKKILQECVPSVVNPMPMSNRRTSGVSRVRFIEIRTTTAWMVDGELWRFRDGTEIAVGDANDLEGNEPMVTGAVALGLINAGKAEAMAVSELDSPDDFDAGEMAGFEAEARGADEAEAPF